MLAFLNGDNIDSYDDISFVIIYRQSIYCMLAFLNGDNIDSYDDIAFLLYTGNAFIVC